MQRHLREQMDNGEQPEFKELFGAEKKRADKSKPKDMGTKNTYASLRDLDALGKQT